MWGFREIVAADFEFAVSPGERPDPVCLVAREIHSGRRFRLWRDELGRVPPYATGPDVLFVAYFASAELGCYRVLGWPMPERILDLFVEFRARTNGLSTAAGNSLLGALTYFGLDSIGSIEKEDMRALVLRGGPWSGAEREAILDYCESDVSALVRLLPVMLPGIDLPRALLRGRYMAAVAAMEHAGVPIDIETLDRFRRHWTDIQTQLIGEIDVDYGVFEGRPSRLIALLLSSHGRTFHGRCLSRASLICLTTPSESRRDPTLGYRHCGNCAARYPTFASTIWRLDVTDAIGRYCPLLDHDLGGINRATPITFSAPASGCAA